MRFGRRHHLSMSRIGLTAGSVIASTALIAAEPAPYEIAVTPEAVAESFIRAIDIPVKNLVELIGAEHGLKVNTSGQVRGSVTKLDVSGTREEMLNAVATQVPIDWFSHGGILYISDPEEEIVQFLPLKTLTLASVKELLEQSGLDHSRHSVEPLKNEAAIRVVGPPMMVEIIEAIVQLSSAAEQHPVKVPSVLVRRGVEESLEFYGEETLNLSLNPPPAQPEIGTTDTATTQQAQKDDS